MEKWESALMKFLQPWKEQDHVLAALVTGSYAVGNSNESSDIDVHIILSGQTGWRERGNQVVDGFLIEYFANPASQIMGYMDDDLRNGSRADANMLCAGMVLFDKTGVLSLLRQRAEGDMKRELAPVDKGALEMMKYAIWDRYDELCACHNGGSPYFLNLYCSLLELLLESYSRFLQTLRPPLGKAYRFFKEEGYRSRYNLGDYPDADFARLYVACVEAQTPEDRSRLAAEIKDYVLMKMGGFAIDGWTYRSALTV